MDAISVLSWLPCGILVVCIAAVLALVDIRTGRGYVLGILSSLHLACTIVVVGGITILAQIQPPPTSPHTYSVTIFLVFYFAPSAYIILSDVIGAAIVAGMARRWLWIVSFVAATAVPFLVAAAPYSFLDLHTDYVVRQVGFLGVLVLPEATVLAYSVTRLRRPVTLVSVRQTARLS